MATIAHGLLEQVVARLRAAPAIVDGAGNAIDVANIRRDHRTVVVRDYAPRLHVIDGPEPVTTSGGCSRREQAFTVAVFVRNDAGFAAADPLKLAVMARLDPGIQTWGPGVLITPGDVTPIAEIADADALRVDMAFTFKYSTGLWHLDTLIT